MTPLSRCDSVIDQLLADFAVVIIKRISERAKIDPDILALSIPGLLHSHWYISDEHVIGCPCCERRKRLSSEETS